MKRWLDSGYELDDDPGRIDRDLVHRFLSGESYWAKGRSPEDVENGPHADLRFLLGTVTAHDFYRQFGFREPSSRIMERPGPNFPDPPGDS